MKVITLFFLSLLSSAMVFAQAPTGGGGIDPSAFSDEMTPLMRERINAELEHNVAALTRQGKLLPLPSDAVSLYWPLRTTTISDADYHGISNWVDLDATYPNHLLDWNCGARTYNEAG